MPADHEGRPAPRSELREMATSDEPLHANRRTAGGGRLRPRGQMHAPSAFQMKKNPGESAFFSLETLREHRLLKTSLWSHIPAHILVILSVPLIYACVVPFMLLDLAVAIYQAICFPVYGIPKVRRRDYLIFDRGHGHHTIC